MIVAHGDHSALEFHPSYAATRSLAWKLELTCR